MAYARIIVSAAAKCFSEEHEKLSVEQQLRFGLRPAHCGDAKVR
jgi:hypothetical protein